MTRMLWWKLSRTRLSGLQLWTSPTLSLCPGKELFFLPTHLRCVQLSARACSIPCSARGASGCSGAAAQPAPPLRIGDQLLACPLPASSLPAWLRARCWGHRGEKKWASKLLAAFCCSVALWPQQPEAGFSAGGRAEPQGRLCLCLRLLSCRDHPLLRLKNVLITPHAGTATLQAAQAMAAEAVANMQAALRGQRIPSQVLPAAPPLR